MVQLILRFAGIVLMLAAPLSAQSTFATITGIVTDSAGASVPGAKIEATHKATNYVFRAESNAEGVYTLANLRDGAYTIQVSAPGFNSANLQSVAVMNREIRRVDMQLEVGTVQTQVEVSAQAGLLETESARISLMQDEYVIKTLPTNARYTFSLLNLGPGTQASTTSASTRFSGSWKSQGDMTVDGITINATDGSQISPLAAFPESFQEVRVDTANNTADVAAVGQMVMVSKSGSNRFHGSAFDYYSSPVFRSRAMLAAQRDLSIRHSPGLSLSGPVWLPRLYNGRNRTFWFMSYETNAGNKINQLLNPTVPIVPWRAGDFSRERVVVRDPAAGNTPFPNNVLPPSRVNATSRKMQEFFYPLPNFGDPNVLASMNYREYKVRDFDRSATWQFRGDHRFSDKHFVYGRFTRQFSPNRYYEPLPVLGRAYRRRDTRALNLSYTHTISNSMMNEIRGGLSKSADPRWGGLMGQQVVKDLGLTGLVSGLPDIPGTPSIGFTNISLTRVRQTEYRNPGFFQRNYQFHDHFSWFRGRHSLKAGASIRRSEGGELRASDNIFGYLTFSNRYSGHDYADFLLGLPQSSARSPGPIDNTRFSWAYDFFVTDEYKVARQLTLSVGVRYEVHPAGMTKFGSMISTFDPVSGNVVIANNSRDLISPYMPDNYVGLVEASQAGYPSNLIKTDWNNLAPRIALAWRPWGNRTVFRAGLGVFYDIQPTTATAVGTPYNVNEPTYTNPAFTTASDPALVLLPNIFPGNSRKATSASLPRAFRLDLRTPYTIQQNFTVEREQWGTAFRASYVGTGQRQGEWSYNLNSPAPDARLFIDKTRAFPRYSGIQYQTNGAGHQYHALELEAKRRMAKGLHFEANWTWARDIGDVERGNGPENPFDRARERGVWPDIPTHASRANVIYDLPFGRGRKFATGLSRKWNMVVGGWTVSFMHSHGSGAFLTPTWAGPDPVGIAQTTSATPAQVTIRPNILRDPNLDPSQRTMARFFDDTAFAPPVRGSFGTSAQGVIKGPGAFGQNAGLYKAFIFSESFRVRWEVTFGNISNHPQWNNPVTSLNSPFFGRVQWAGGERGGQTGLRVEW